MLSVLAVLLPLLLGALLGLGLTLRTGRWTEWLLALSLAPGLGMAVSALLYFFWMLIFLPNQNLPLYLTLEGALAGLLALGVWRVHAQKIQQPQVGGRWRRWALPRWPLRTWVCAAAAVLLVVALANFIENWLLTFFANPDGNWDAWAIWNLHARFIYSGGAAWQAGFSPELGWWSHPDYPLLLPGFVARLWGLFSTQSQWIPALVELTFLLSILGGVVAGVLAARGWKLAVFAGLFCIPLLQYSFNFQQYADMPLAFFFLAANLLLAQENSTRPGQAGWRILAGFAAGAAVWTKNEGWAFLLALVCVELIRLGVERPALRGWLWRMGWLGLGWLPFGLAALVFKLSLAAPNDLVDSFRQSGLLALLTDFSRYELIWRNFLDLFFQVGTLKIALLPVMIGFGLLLGLKPFRRGDLGPAWIGLRLLGVALVYFGIYLLTPYPLEWHLSTSMSRLICQLLPSLILMLFLQVRGLDERPEAA